MPICLLLDVVQVAYAHTEINLAKAFAEVLMDYGIADKVSGSLWSIEEKTYQERL
jgi:hypothetical protein